MDKKYSEWRSKINGGHVCGEQQSRLPVLHQALRRLRRLPQGHLLHPRRHYHHGVVSLIAVLFASSLRVVKLSLEIQSYRDDHSSRGSVPPLRALAYVLPPSIDSIEMPFQQLGFLNGLLGRRDEVGVDCSRVLAGLIRRLVAPDLQLHPLRHP